MHTAKGEHMTQEALRLALEALEHAAYCVQKNYCPDKMGHDWDDTIASIKEALEQPDIIQVSPLEFVTRVTGKEEIIGEPAFWAQWPSKEKNT
jgi:hypothetical protein